MESEVILRNTLEARLERIESMLKEGFVGGNLMMQEERLTRIESMLETLVSRKVVKEWYTTDEAADRLGKRPFTVREWCRSGRINAAKQGYGRGRSREWMISHQEVERILKEGLLEVG